MSGQHSSTKLVDELAQGDTSGRKLDPRAAHASAHAEPAQPRAPVAPMAGKPVVFFSHSSRDKRELALLKELFVQKTGGTVEVFLSSDGQSIPLKTVRTFIKIPFRC